MITVAATLQASDGAPIGSVGVLSPMEREARRENWRRFHAGLPVLCELELWRVIVARHDARCDA